MSFLWYWWAAWWGKTILAAMWISMMCKKYPWVRYWVFRRFITDCLDTTFKSFTKALHILGLLEAENIDVLKKNPDKYDFCVRNGWKEIVFSNWSEIWFRWLQDKPTDVHFTKIWWLELTGAFVDESNECPDQWVSVLKKRVWRHMNSEYKIPRKVLCTFNPDKWWVYRTFYTPFKQWRELEWIMFIPALPTDNPYLTQEYLDELKNEKNEVIKQRLYYWNFDYDDTPWRLFEYDDINNLWTNNLMWWEQYISIDVARKWKDKTVIYIWEGFDIVKVIQEPKSDISVLSERVKWLMREWEIPRSKVIADEDWVWWWLVDNLKCQWFINNAAPRQVKRPTLSTRRNFQNLKTQCYFELAKHIKKISLRDETIKESLIEELDVIVQIDLDDDTKIKIISKEDIKDKLWRSPDYSDAMMMRMYYEIKHFPDVDEEVEKEIDEKDPLGIFAMDDIGEVSIDFSVY